MGSSHVVFLNIFFYGEFKQKRHWQKNLPVGFNGLMHRENLKGLAQAKIIKKSVILFRVLNMTI